ncbi:DNA-binding protein [Burkholderia gladioli]|uniref:DNA-binding protein n=1 Tax=Burkholderia gladioli TaxID=28095 RepID=UPI000D00988D|nr:DNA-binding protein [Burkholderia gladioli]MBJ9663968.1 DNA-binding protein [Burkholderia gladioli]MBU9215705.1 DNA-binding protein [Burkholderia gladioli]MDN7721583.1 DNA-binding protein [Burkholderia gladioli]MDN7800227.1 DNA-binding protein [Burkholderia gladioli]PRE80269.1 DNA-binding protein [Burkholderia gladioli]
MDTCPNQSDAQFQAFLAKLLTQPQPTEWGEKQRIELDMARALSTSMLRVAEHLHAQPGDTESWLALYRYGRALDFILGSLAGGRDIHPRTLRTILKLAHFEVDANYPD